MTTNTSYQPGRQPASVTYTIGPSNWERSAQALHTFVDTHGRLPKQKERDANDHGVGGWLCQQRAHWNTLTDDQRNRLLAIPGVTIPVTNDDKWAIGFSHLQDFADTHSRLPSKRETSPDGYPVGKWLDNQHSYPKRLTDQRRQLLHTITGYTDRQPFESTWEPMADLLAVFVSEHERMPTQKETTDSGVAIGRWVNRQRSDWDTLTKAQQERLTSIPGFVAASRDGRWNHMYELTREYLQAHPGGGCPRNTAYKGEPIGAWLHDTQRKGTRTPEQKRQLAILATLAPIR